MPVFSKWSLSSGPLTKFCIQVYCTSYLQHACYMPRQTLRNTTQYKTNQISIPNILGAEIAQWYSAGLRTEWSGVRVPEVAGNFASRPALGLTQPPIQWVSGALSLWVKRPGCEADHSLSSSAEVKE
jgi:hypothetical protein